MVSLFCINLDDTKLSRVSFTKMNFKKECYWVGTLQEVRQFLEGSLKDVPPYSGLAQGFGPLRQQEGGMVGRLQVDGHQLKQHRLRAGAFALTRRPKKE